MQKERKHSAAYAAVKTIKAKRTKAQRSACGSQNCQGKKRAETNTLRKADLAMETNVDGTYFQEGDHVRIKRTQETGRINATDGGVVYVLMDETNETKLFSAFVDKDAYIELASAGTTQSMLLRKGMNKEGA